MRPNVWISFASAVIALSAASLALKPQADEPQPSTSFSADLPRTGTAAPGLESIDRTVEEVLDQHGIPGASVTIAYNGTVLLTRGYGFANLDAGEPMRPETRFVLASVSKAITAVTMLAMVEQGTFGLDDAAYPLVEPIEPPPGTAANQEVFGITIRQLLHHEGGWNRQTSGDPATWGRRVMRALRLRTLPTMFDLARYMLAQPLDFAPGTKAVYSNFGYDLCGVIVTRQSGRFYATTAEELVLRRMGIDGIKPDVAAPRYFDDEARRYSPGTEHMLPGGHPPMNLAAGGWTARSGDLVRFLTALDGTRTGTPFLSASMLAEMTKPSPTVPPRAHGTYFGLGWDVVEPKAGGFRYGKDGGIAGISTWIEHLPLDVNSPSGGGTIDWAIFFNSNVHNEEGKVALGVVTERLRRVMESLDWRAIDRGNAGR